MAPVPPLFSFAIADEELHSLVGTVAENEQAAWTTAYVVATAIRNYYHQKK